MALVFIYTMDGGSLSEMEMDRDKVKEEITAILVEQLGVDPAIVTLESSFEEDLKADSLDLVELIMEFEDRFERKIPDEDAERLKTVGDVLDYIVSDTLPPPVDEEVHASS